MKIRLAQVTPDGITLEEDIPAAELDLETDTVKFLTPVNIKAEVSKVTNVVSVSLSLSGMMSLVCGRCLKEFKASLDKRLKLNCPVEKNQQFVDLNPDIREEIILDYPLQPLCAAGCQGLCPKCGADLNSGKCDCN